MQMQHSIMKSVLIGLLVLVCTSSYGVVQGEEWTPLHSQGDRAKDLVVWITGAGFTDGAGIVFHVDGKSAWALTARHVVRHGSKTLTGLKAQLRLWPGKVFPIEVERMHAEKDLAVIRIDLGSLGMPDSEVARKLPFGSLGKPGDLQRGDNVFPIGHAADGTWISPNRPAIFHSFDPWDPERQGSLEVIRVEHFCPPGHSGGALFDGQWRLVGMLFENSEPFCRAFRIDTLLSQLQSWKYGISLYEDRRAEKKDAPLPDEIKVAVVNFSDRSGANLADLGPAAQDVLTSFLVNLPRVTVLTRDRIDLVRKEAGLDGTSLGSQQISRLGKLLDVEAIVTGSVTRYDIERQRYEGYNTSALRDTYRMSVSLQVIDVETGQVRFSDIFETEDLKSYLEASTAPDRPLNRSTELLDKLLEQASGELQKGLTQVAMGLASGGQLIQLPITTVPPGADVVVAGNYVGSTPLTLELEMGIHELTLDHPGYRAWKRKVKVEPGTRVDVSLTREMR